MPLLYPSFFLIKIWWARVSCSFKIISVNYSLHDVVWELRIHFDSQANLDMKLCSSDVTFLNLYAVLQTQGFYFFDDLYQMKKFGIGEERQHGLELIDTNIKLQQLEKEYKHSLVLNLLVRAAPTFLCQRGERSNVSNVINVCHREEQLAAILYQPAVLYDLNEPAVLVVDLEGVVFHSSPTQPTVVCTQESINFRKDKLKDVMEEEPVFEQAHNSSDESEDAFDSDNNPFCMEEYMISEDVEIIEGNKLAHEEDVDQDEDSDENLDEEQLHYEGDT